MFFLSCIKKIRNLAYRWIAYIFSFLYIRKDLKIWVFGEWFGEKCNDNCAFLANYLANHHPQLKLFWIAKKNCDISMLNRRVTVVEKDSNKAMQLLKTAGVIVMNQGFSDLSSNGYNTYGTAKTINLWHGVMWKKIGNDSCKSDGFFFRIYCFFINPVLRSRYYLIPSEEYGKNMISAFGAKKKNFIKCGYPRNSLFFDKYEIEKSRQDVLEKISLPDTKQTIIAYMPTFRDNDTKQFDLSEISDNVFTDFINRNNILIVQKKHSISEKRGVKLKCSDRIICLDDIPASRLLAAADMLITDYSSCFFDYLLLDRPIIHFIYDYNNYKYKDRGLYYDVNDVAAGDVATSVVDLIDAIRQNFLNPQKNHERRMEIKSKYVTYESEKTCEIIYNQLFSV